MSDIFQQAQDAADMIRQHAPNKPAVGIILGSGLGAFAERVEGAVRIPYREIPHCLAPHVVGHAGELVMGTLHGVPVAVFSGRVHAYEGHDMERVTLSVRILKALGAEKLIITNAAGGANADFDPGDFMVISDHLNMTGHNPLRGPHDERLGPRFPDMTHAYCEAGRTAWHKAAQANNLTLREGVYAGLMGPCYETPAEIRMLQRLGADAVGMSTVSEVIVARHAGLQVAGLSVITNRAAGLSAQPLSHKEVTEIATKMRDVLCDLLAGMVKAWV